MGAGWSLDVLLPGGSEWVPLRSAVGKRVRWLSPSEGVLELEPSDLPEGSVVRWVRWGRGRRPAEERYFVVRGGGIAEEEVVGEEDEDAGEHAGHRIKARVAVTKSGLRIPKFWYVASGLLKGAEGGVSASLESLKRWIDQALAAHAPKAARLPERVRRAVLERLPDWADGAYIERSRPVALAEPVPADLRRRVLEAVAEAAAGLGGGAQPLKRIARGRVEAPEPLLAPSPPPKALEKLLPLRVFPAAEGLVGLQYYRLSPDYVAERLVGALDRLAPEWRRMQLHVPDALLEAHELANALKLLRERLGLRKGTGAELVREFASRLAEWEGSVATPRKAALVEVVPVKRSRGGGGYYFSDEWRRLPLVLPLEAGDDPYLWKGAVILRTGETYAAEPVASQGRALATYFSLPPPPGG